MVKAKWFSWLLNKQADRIFSRPPFVRFLKFDLKSTLIMIDIFFTAIASDITRRVCECIRCVAVPHVHCVWWHLDVQTDIYLPVPSTLRNR